MKSNLKQIYEERDSFDILNKSRYHFIPNPIYQVNNFVIGIDEKLNRNFLENLEDLKIKDETIKSIKSDYDYDTNTLYCKDSKSDVFGLLHVASNDKDKKYTGIITEDEVGYGLNNGITELFTNCINKKRFDFPFESTIAKALLMVDFDIMVYSYFNNAGNDLMMINNNIKNLMQLLDNYHDNYIKLMKLYNERFAKEFRKLKGSERTKELEKIREKIYSLESSNFTNVSNIFDILIELINNSFLENSDKQRLFFELNHEFNLLFEREKFCYLNGVSDSFNDFVYVKRKRK